MDYSSVIKSVELMPDQVRAGWNEIENIRTDYHNIYNVVVCGMGGSALGARIINSFSSSIPIEIVNGYNLPDFAGSNTLIIISSYSGNTEETVSCFEQAIAKNLQTFAIAVGGKVADVAEANSIPLYRINPKENPSEQPRLASGYSIGAMLSLFSKLGILNLSKSDLDNSLNFEFNREEAERIASELKDNGAIFVASEHLVGASHAAKNMFNETAKAFSTIFEIPELNHHLMEGLTHPESLKNNIKFLFIESDLYHQRIIKRYEITKDVVSKNDFKYISYNLKSKDKLAQIFEVLSLGGFLQIYLGQIYNSDPVSIPWVDYFKDKMTS